MYALSLPLFLFISGTNQVSKNAFCLPMVFAKDLLKCIASECQWECVLVISGLTH